MRARRIIFLPLLLALGLAACGSEGGDAPSSTTVPTSDSPLVTYEKGGGFAPVSQKLVVEADGSATATAQFPGQKPAEQSAEFQLTDDQLAELTDAVESTELEPYDGVGYCADCFTFSLETANGSTDFDEGMLGGYDQEPIVDQDVIDLQGIVGPLLEQNVPGPEPQTGA